ncbi:MAG: biotin--[Prevotella sp.]|nr:biotin--[acetyl-CoA-carboxylase] ligase [Prevotella sp.]
MSWNIIHIDETDSTNRWIREEAADAYSAVTAQRVGSQEAADGLCVVADYQTAGRGQGTNRWESERGKNLLFSMLFRPADIPANRQFHISMAISLAICDALGQYIGDLSIKWPNDIYWRDGKIAGILIEHRLHGTMIRDSIIGVGLNVNQRHFCSDAPNPVSLWQICEQDTDRNQLLRDILQNFSRLMGNTQPDGLTGNAQPDGLMGNAQPDGLTGMEIKSRYMALLYRRRGFHPYADKQGAFMAEIANVEPDGHLLLRDDSGHERRYAFKEVTFVM